MTAIEQITEAVYERRPVLQQIVGARGQMTLTEYLRSFSREVPETTVESRGDFVCAVFAYANRLLGVQVAELLREQLTVSPVMITGNHHGPDWISITSQPEIAWGVCRKGFVVPVFACGGVPLNNLSYGRGIRVSDRVRINVFPDRYKETLVSVAPPFDRTMVTKALASIGNDVLSDAQAKAVRMILEQDYTEPSILSCCNFSDQSTLLNARLWRRLFAHDVLDQVPPIAYLEIEPLVVMLLERDFFKSEFVKRMLFDEITCLRVIVCLQEIPGCWSVAKLRQLLDPAITGEARRRLAAGAGTMFFWGVDQKGRHIPLALEDGFLQGVGDDGQTYRWEFKPEPLLAALKARRIFPNLFVTHLPLTFARGFKPYGGFMQTDYLTRMKRGILQVLQEIGQMNWLELVRAVQTENFLDGLIFAVKNNSHGVVPVEAIDVIAAGGFTAAQLKQLDVITVNEATYAGLIEMYTTIYGPEKDVSLIERARGELSHSRLVQL